MKRWRAMAVALALLTFGSGCAGDKTAASDDNRRDGSTTSTSSASSPRARLSKTPSATISAGSAQAQYQIVLTGGPGFPEKGLRIKGKGFVDLKGAKSGFSTSVPGIGTVETRIDRGAVYQKVPERVAKSLGSKPWIKTNGNVLIKLSKIDVDRLDLSSITSVSPGDPSQAVRMFNGATKKVDVVGVEKLRGETVTHYRVELSLEKAVASLPGEEAKLLKQFSAGFTDRDIQADAWIDAKNRLRKTTLSTSYSYPILTPISNAAGVGKKSRIEVSLELYNFGKKFDVDIPKPNEVTELSDLFEGKLKSLKDALPEDLKDQLSKDLKGQLPKDLTDQLPNQLSSGRLKL